MIFLIIILIGSSNDSFPWKRFESTHLASQRGISSANRKPGIFELRGMAQLVARTAGGREVASSSLVTPTMKL